MLVSAREAARLLREVGLSRPQVCRLLETGLAGPAHHAGAAHLYDAVRVAALREAPDVTLPTGTGPVLIARVGQWRGLAGPMATEEQLAAVAGPWPATALQRLQVRLAAQAAAEREADPVPFLATVSGYVVVAAEVTGTCVTRAPVRGATVPGTTEHTYFELREPSAWARDAVGARCPTGPGASWLWLS